ncbi:MULTISPECIES: hypothetical protein [Paenibacillus]|uniref:hypothetical protein n=1 Tax=Paenibacillus TaxID=44249 RepID=UPI00096E4377|nr:hypothetical protein [Paenibacillus odorifer]OMD92724.1 hypothetical protein BSK67_18345 [Paenibacillus odorifer]
METTALGDIEGYQHIRVKAEGTDLREVSNCFFKELMNVVEGKNIIWRTTPTAIETEDGYKISARVHVK